VSGVGSEKKNLKMRQQRFLVGKQTTEDGRPKKKMTGGKTGEENAEEKAQTRARPDPKQGQLGGKSFQRAEGGKKKTPGTGKKKRVEYTAGKSRIGVWTLRKCTTWGEKTMWGNPGG